MVKHCSYGQCRSDSRHKDRPHMQGVFFVPFPKPKTDIDRCRLWIKRCNRPHSQLNVEKINKDIYVCSKHFVGGNGPTLQYPDIVFSDPRMAVTPTRKRVKQPGPDFITTFPGAPRDKKVRKNLLSTNDQTSTTILSDSPSPRLEQEEVVPSTSTCSINTDHCYGFQSDILNETQPPLPIKQINIGVQTTTVETREVSTQTEDLSKGALKRTSILEDVTKDDASCKYYTGLTIAILNLVLQLINPVAQSLKYWRFADTTDKKVSQRKNDHILSIKEELLMTLMRCRRGLDVQILANMFAVSQTTVSRVFITYINFLYHHFQFLIKWPTKEQVRMNLPKSFKHFKKTRVIIDCTEIFVQRPSLPSSQRITWSSYKQHNTFKALIGITPTGTFSFVSKLYTGSMSDRRITIESGFIDKLEYGDDVMADRGFIIRDLVTMKHATLNIPPFAMGKQLSSAAVTKTRRIASARIHVERAIGRLKDFKILQGVIPINLRPVLDQVLFLCAALCNLDNKLVK